MEKISAEISQEKPIGIGPMEKRPFFSIIIPVYNVAPYLRECLDSVLAQTFKDWEAICVDDGSTDGSGEILDEYGARDKRFRVVHQGNAGVSAARNRGLEEAKGEWIWFVDADDSIRQGSLAIIRRNLDDDNTPDVVKIYISRAPFTSTAVSESRVVKRKPIERCTRTFRYYRCGLYHSIMARKVIDGLRFVPKMAMGEDALFHILAYYRFCTEICINEPLYYYRDRAGSAMTQIFTERMVRDWLALHIRMMRIFRDNDEDKNPRMSQFLKWNSSYVFYTEQLSFFRLPLHERRQCYSSWLKLIKLADKISPHTWWKRPLIWLFSGRPKPVLASSLVAVLYRLQSTIRRIYARND